MKQWLTLIFIFSSFSIMAQLTSDEKSLIHNGDKTTPLPVLKITDKQDSLFLRTPSKNFDFEKDKEDIAFLIARLRVTMATESGVGIAAPQVSIGRNLFLFTRIDLPEKPVIAVINPKIINHPAETICFERDGCLSIPDISGNSIRYPWVEVEYTTEEGKLVKERLEGYSRMGDFTGVIFQHEFDHLQGILFIDKLCDEQED